MAASFEECLDPNATQMAEADPRENHVLRSLEGASLLDDIVISFSLDQVTQCETPISDEMRQLFSNSLGRSCDLPGVFYPFLPGDSSKDAVVSHGYGPVLLQDTLTRLLNWSELAGPVLKVSVVS